MKKTEPDWRPSLPQTGEPIYLAIADAMAADIASGRLQPGQRLPPHRLLADRLGINLTTVTRGYAEALRRGLIEAGAGRGSFVRGANAAVVSAGGRRLDMTMNLPPLPDDATLRRELTVGFQSMLQRSDLASFVTYGQTAGGDEDRAAGAAWLAPRLGMLDPDRVIVCGGIQTALLALMTTFAGKGDVVLTESVTYPGFRALAAHLGIRLRGLPMDREGLRPEALDAACHEAPPRALYCVPTIHNPTTATMSGQRRQAIVEIARRHRLPIFEDDAYGPLPEETLPPLATLAPELTFHVAGLAKTVAPGLRIAYLIAPAGPDQMRLAGAVRATTLMAPPLMAGLATRWIADGTARRILTAIRAESTARQRLARELLPAGSFAAHPNGHHLWLSLTPPWSRSEFEAHLRRSGLAVVPSDAFAVDDAPPNAVRIALGAARSREEVRRALQLVADALGQSRMVLPTLV